MLLGKTNRQNQDIAKSWKNQIFNYFLIRTLLRKSNHQNPDIAKSWKNQFLNFFLIRTLIRKKQPPKPRYCQNLERSYFQLILNENFNFKKSNHNNQDIAKNWKTQFFNCFSIKI